MEDLINQLGKRLRGAMGKALGPEYSGVDPQIRPSVNPKFGDFQANAAMSLGKKLGQNPRQVAEAIVGQLDWGGLLAGKPTVAGPGFINLTLSAEALAGAVRGLAGDERVGVGKADKPEAVVVDYSGPNVAKEMHVGHIRSTVIGDSIARVLEFRGHRVIRQNHLGDWGTQFGMLIEYLNDLIAGKAPILNTSSGPSLLHWEIGDLDDFYRAAKVKFDADPEFADRAHKRVVALQGGDAKTREYWEELVGESKVHFEENYRWLSVFVVKNESGKEEFRPEDFYCPESFYNPYLPNVVAMLKERGLTQTSDGAVCVFPKGFEAAGHDGKPLPFIIQKSDGGYLYATTDLAALWYRSTQLHAQRIIYVTDARQRQHFAMLFAVGRQMEWIDGHCRAEHVPFGTILGKDGKPFKTRSGETVKLAELLEEAGKRAKAIIAAKNPDVQPDDIDDQVVEAVAIGAIKYADLSNDRIKDYVFDWDKMLAMDGNTAPYLQYAYARIRSIFRKAGEQGIDTGTAGEVVVAHPAEKALVLKLMQLPSVIEGVESSLEPHRLCGFLYELATGFSSFYENCPVLTAETEVSRRSRLMLSDLTARALKLGLGLLGIEVLERM